MLNQVILHKTEKWWFKCKRIQAKNRTTENMLRVARKDLNKERERSRWVDYFGKREAYAKEEVKELQTQIKDMQKQKKESDEQIDQLKKKAEQKDG